jgi:molecular chaperone GrpE
MSTEPENDVTTSSSEVDAEAEEEFSASSPEVDEESLSGEAQRQRAGAAAAYAAAQHSAPPKPEPEPGATEDQVTTSSVAPSPEAEVEAQAGQAFAVGDDASVPEADAPSELDELTAKAQKADEYLLLAQRTQADFENFRKRATRDAALAQERGIAKLAKELLPAVDNLDRALQAAATYGTAADPDAAAGDAPTAAGKHESQLIDGLKLVQAEVLAALARVGIEPFSPVGEPFDPQHHEAVAQHQFEDQMPGTVVEVYQQGFRYGEVVLRPARVLVAA